MSRALRIGTRASALALWQATHVQGCCRGSPAPLRSSSCTSRPRATSQTQVPLWQAGGRAFFTKEIDRALLSGEVDVAVHSLKDLATQLEPGVALAAALTRADARDAS